jgi:hypothetical protein
VPSPACLREFDFFFDSGMAISICAAVTATGGR